MCSDTCVLGLGLGIPIGLLILVLVFVVRSERQFDREANERQARHVDEMRQLIAWMVLDRDRLKALREELQPLSWPELRQRCETETGKPCECATRDNVANRIHDTRKRRERATQGQHAGV